MSADEKRGCREQRAARAGESDEQALLRTGLDGVIASWSSGAERLFGYGAEQVLGQPLAVLLALEGAAQPPEQGEGSGRSERSEPAAHSWRTRAGERIEVALAAEPVRDAAGDLVQIAWYARGPREPRREDLSRARLAAIVDGSEDAIISKDLRGVIQSWNRSAERIFGYTAAEAVGRSITMLIPPERQAEEEDILARIRRAERVEHYDTVRVTKRGAAIEVSLTISPVRDASGAIVGASKIARDVTERRRTERELAAQREWFRVTLSSIGEAVITCDVAGGVRFLNTAAEKLTGWAAADAIGQPVSEVFRLLHEESRQAVENPAEQVLRSGIATNGTDHHLLLVCRDGSERPIAQSTVPIRSAEQEVIGAALVFRDVSSERRVEAALAEQREWRERLLESERAARTAAERLSRLKDEFVATLSHELRTPLNAILGWTRVLQMDPSRPELVERGLEVIERNTHLQAQLVSDLLDMSRLISGKLALDLRQADLPSIAEAAVESARPGAHAKGIALYTRITQPLSPCAGDAARLQQVIWNLLSNAVKFTGAGGWIEVRLEEVGAEAWLTVADTGIGIRAEFLPSLFERFRQGDSAINRRYGGLGLGLAIVKQLVELHGGSVDASSPGEGRGSTFRVRLPLRSSAALEQNADSPTHTQSEPAADLSGLRVLVVEDDADAAELLARFLHDAGAQVTSVSSAAQALAAVGELAPQVLVSDIGMPEIDGYELIRQLRALGPSHGGSIPALAVTAFARPEDRTRALLAGYQAYLTKPIEPPELIATVRMLSGLTLERPRER
jgi:PAS domain S-box-containing protein